MNIKISKSEFEQAIDKIIKNAERAKRSYKESLSGPSEDLYR